MKEEALSIIRAVDDPSKKLNLLREYLQAVILRSLHESEAFTNLCFVGGTALRFAFNLPRFSEDIDFSLLNAPGYSPEKWMDKLRRDLDLGGFDVAVSWNDRTVVHKAWIKTANLLKEAGLAAMPQQKLSIKLEIDTNPPSGGTCVRSVITRHMVIALQYYSMNSLMAGKVHALLTRGYGKGRDWYDLLWYRGARPPQEPDLDLLQNALDRSQGAGAVRAAQWKEIVIALADKLDCAKLANDVRPFLERPQDADLITAENIRSALS